MAKMKGLGKGLDAPQILQVKGNVLPAHQERAVAGCQLAEHHRMIVLALIVNVDAALRPRQTDVALSGDHGGHHLVGPAAVGQLNGKAFIGEEAQLHGHILRRVEHRMGHFVQAYRGQFRLCRPRAAAAEQRQQHQGGQHRCEDLFHAFTPNK